MPNLVEEFVIVQLTSGYVQEICTAPIDWQALFQIMPAHCEVTLGLNCFRLVPTQNSLHIALHFCLAAHTLNAAKSPVLPSVSLWLFAHNALKILQIYLYFVLQKSLKVAESVLEMFQEIMQKP